MAREEVEEVRQQARHHGDGDGENSRSVSPAREEAQDDDHPGYDGADEIEFRGFDDGNRAVNAGNGRCQREILDYRQKLLYYANFKLHFGISDEMCRFVEDFCDVMTSSAGAVDPDQSDDNPALSETSSFPKYDRDIESVLDFRDRKITIVLTLNVDGVRFKKLSRSESWPVYIRLEGLPFKEKNKYENIILAGIMFTRKPPTETLLTELFSRLKHELEVLQREGIPIRTASDTWICTPKLVNGIIDFAALQTLYGLPRWQSLQGCHLCTFPGERSGRRVIWFNRCNAMVGDFGLEGDWYVPADSVLAFEAMGEKHREFLFEQRLSQRFSVVVVVCSHLTCGDGYGVWVGVQFGVGFSSRLSDGKHMHASSDYWKKSAETDTTQGVVYLETPDEEARFGQVIAFGFDSYTGECCVLLEEFVTTDPFAALYEKAFITGKMRECSISLNSAKAIQDTCSQIPLSSDSIVRSLTEVVAAQSDALVGVVTTLNALLEFARANQRSIAKAEAVAVKNSSHTLPEQFFLHGRHLKQNWDIKSDPPFKRQDHSIQATDFFRHYLVKACDPVEEIQKYTYRRTDRYPKAPQLKNLPDAVIEALVGCCLDGIGLGANELVESSVEDLIRNPTRYWETLGNDNSSRSRAFQERKEFRAIWGPCFRDALTKAMADVRQYVPRDGRLVPPPKTRKTSTPAATADEADDYDIFDDEVRRTCDPKL
ncbi:unnamed protein product [Heligmosomoides polygyrus]|uniref:C2 domain-containing protein n=1 Tax=Heligmosomoides polygyrus TaxID=6339 RepID=A0A183G6P4_HELPZ|nr:unnamed protein product [Heligmosomoides polygyrus]